MGWLRLLTWRAAGTGSTLGWRWKTTIGTCLTLTASQVLVGELTSKTCIGVVRSKARTETWLWRLQSLLLILIGVLHWRLLTSLGLKLLIVLEVTSTNRGTLHLRTRVFVIRVSKLSVEDGLGVCRGCRWKHTLIRRGEDTIIVETSSGTTLSAGDIEVKAIWIHDYGYV